jgi:hypothetical protein
VAFSIVIDEPIVVSNGLDVDCAVSLPIAPPCERPGVGCCADSGLYRSLDRAHVLHRAGLFGDYQEHGAVSRPRSGGTDRVLAGTICLPHHILVGALNQAYHSRS